MRAVTATTPRRAAIYLRQSLDRHGDELAVSRQREDCEEICRARGWQVVRVFTDNSLSASKATVQRPAYEELLTAYRNREFDALVCYDLDRLTRQPRQLEDWIDAAEAGDLLMVTANGEADFTTDAGRLFARVKAAVARSETERKGARQTRAARQRAAQGKPAKGVRPMGYELDGTVIPQEAAVVRRVFDAFAAGDSLVGIARALNADAVPTRRGGPWRPSTVRTLLLNARYSGRQVYKGEVLDVAGQWEAIVPEDTFALVQARLTDPRRKTNRVGHDRKHLGSGLYRCGTCGGNVRAWSGHRYRCADACFSRSGGQVDDYVRRAIAARLRRDDVRDLLAAPKADTTPLQAEAKRLRQRLEAIAGDYDAGRIDGVRFAAATDTARSELAAVERRLAEATGGRVLADALDAADPGGAFLDAPLSRQRAMLDRLVTVTLYPGVHGSTTFRPESVRIEWKG